MDSLPTNLNLSVMCIERKKPNFQSSQKVKIQPELITVAKSENIEIKETS